MHNLVEYFKLCITEPWQVIGTTQYKFVEDKEKNVVYIVFECSREKEDWKVNFSFPAKPYKRMTQVWFAHGGFLEKYKEIRDILFQQIEQFGKNKYYFILGYSHGGGLATLLIEDMIFNGYNAYAHVFGSPRVVWGFLPKEVKSRFVMTRHCNRGDIVTHLPFLFMGFRDACLQKIRYGKPALISHLPHYPERYIENLS